LDEKSFRSSRIKELAKLRILSAGGRRRLDVATTRAKERVIVVSSFRYSDINSTQVKHRTGLEFLKNYIEYVSSGGKLLSHGEITNEPMNDFEMDVFDAPSSRGISIVPQVGCSKFRIDLAACHLPRFASTPRLTCC
jgi:hypothetical protein